MSEGGGGFFNFIDILKGLPVIPKIIMFLGIVLLLTGFFSGTFSFLHNPRISCGIGLMFASLGWRAWKHARWHEPGPPYSGHWQIGKVLSGLFWWALSVFMFYITDLAS